MKIKTQFFLTMVIFGLILLVISGSVITTNQEIDRLGKQEEIAVGIERGSDELNYLSDDYLIHREPRQRARWEAKWSAVFKDISKLNPGSPEQNALVDNIEENQRRLKAVFADVSSILERPSPGGRDAEAVRASVEVSWTRMAVQTRGTAFDASRLSQVLQDRKDGLRQTNNRLILILLSLFTAYFIVNYITVYRRTLRSISDLQAGAEVVGAGNIDFAVEVRREDEIGQLSRAFNRMTASLKDVTASKTELESEIAERAKAEAALSEERERLAVTLGSIGDGVIATDIDANIVLLNGVAAELTGWTPAEAAGKPIKEVFNIINEVSRKPADDPVRKVLKTGNVVGLANHTALIAKDGTERSIADSCAPIRDKKGGILGVVLVFRDVTEDKEAEKKALARYRILSMASAAKSLDEFLQMLLDEIEEITRSRIGFYHFLEDDQETLLLQGWSTNTLKNLCTAEGKGGHYPISEAGVWVEAVHKKEPVIHNDYDSLTNKKGLPPGHAPVTREMVVPIIRDEKIVAVVGVGNKPADYDRADVDTALFLADFSWEIVERRKAEEQLKFELETSRRFLEIAHRCNGVPQLLNEFIEEIQDLTGCKAVGIRILDELGNIPYIAYAGFSQPFNEKESPLSVHSDRCMCVNVINETTDPDMAFYTERGSFFMNGTTKFLATVSEEEKGETRNVCNAVGYESVALIPIRSGARVLGLIHLADDKENMVPPDMVKRLEHMAGVLGVSIEKTEAQESLALLHNITDICLSSLDAKSIATEFINIVADKIGAGQVIVALVDSNKQMLNSLSEHGLPEGALEKILPIGVDSEHEAAVVLKSGEPLLVEDVTAQSVSTVAREAIRQIGDIRSFALFPLKAGKQSVGTVSFAWPQPRKFSRNNIEFIHALTAELAIGLQNARLYAAERKVAETLQATMLTLPAAIPDIEFGHIYRSATETAKVGGDFYDLFELEHDRLGIVIGDVAGKGLEAAALTMLIKSTIKAYAYENFFPASIMAKTNDLLRRATVSMSDFVTAFFGILDKKTGHLTYCSGGHPPAVLQRIDGTLEWLTEGSTIIGALPNVSFKDAGIIVEPGDRLILYTDGVTEARRKSHFFGEEGLIKILLENSDISVPQVPLAIYDHISEYTGGTLADDVALLVVGLLPPGKGPVVQDLNATNVAQGPM